MRCSLNINIESLETLSLTTTYAYTTRGPGALVFVAHQDVEAPATLTIDGNPHATYEFTNPSWLAIPDHRAIEINLPSEGSEHIIAFHHALHPNVPSLKTALFTSGQTLVSICQHTEFSFLTYIPVRWIPQGADGASGECVYDGVASLRVRIEADCKQFPFLISNGDLGQQERNKERHARTFAHSKIRRLANFSLVAGNMVSDLTPHVTKRGRRTDILITADAKYQGNLEYAGMAFLHAMKHTERSSDFVMEHGTYHIVGLETLDRETAISPGLCFVRVEDLVAHYKRSTDQDFRRIARLMGIVCAEHSLTWEYSVRDSWGFPMANIMASPFISTIFDETLEKIRLADEVLLPVIRRCWSGAVQMNQPSAKENILPKSFDSKNSCGSTCVARVREEGGVYDEALPILHDTLIADWSLLMEAAPWLGKARGPAQQLSKGFVLSQLMHQLSESLEKHQGTSPLTLTIREPIDKTGKVSWEVEPATYSAITLTISYNVYDKKKKSFTLTEDVPVILKGTQGTFQLTSGKLKSHQILIVERDYSAMVFVKDLHLAREDLLVLVRDRQLKPYLRWHAMQRLWAMWTVEVLTYGLESSSLTTHEEVLPFILETIKDSSHPALSAYLLTPPPAKLVAFMLECEANPRDLLVAQETISRFIASRFQKEITAALDTWSDKGRLVEINFAAQSRRAKKNVLMDLLSHLVHDDESLSKFFSDSFDRAYIYGDRKSIADMLIKRDHEVENYLGRLHTYCKGFDPVGVSSWLQTVASTRKDTHWLREYIKTQEEAKTLHWDSVALRGFLRGLEQNAWILGQRDGDGRRLFSEMELRLRQDSVFGTK